MAYVTEIGFKEFIALCYKGKCFRGTPAGDFIEDAFEDKKFKDFKTSKSLLGYLGLRSGVCQEARDAAHQVFRIWEQTHGSMLPPKKVKIYD